MQPRYYLAFDLGAESGRAVLGAFDGVRVDIDEVSRFPTGGSDADLCDDGVQRWRIDSIFGAVSEGIALARSRVGSAIAGIGVDSWGVDFGLYDAAGVLLARPVCYRDRSHIAARESVLGRISANEIWDATGIQGMAFNTLYQIEAINRRDSGLLARADCLLTVPDVLHNYLIGGGHRAVESTDASTTQMMVPGRNEWNRDLLERLGLPSHFLPAIVDAGTKVGATSDGIAVIAPATHDTASAVVAAPYSRSRTNCEWAFLSSGTWSLVGSELSEPCLDRNAMGLGFSNERGAGGATRFLKNIMGLWLVQQCRRSIIASEGREYSYAELTELASAADCESVVDAAADRFLNPTDMVSEIRAACRETHQAVPSTPGELVRCCLNSLALAYRGALRDMSGLLGREFGALHIVGGGSANELLNQWTADACGIPVLAGPREATAIGNVLGQMVGDGTVGNWREARLVSIASSSPMEYCPRESELERWARRESAAAKIWKG
jgi:rhamnulokinase